MVKKDWVAIVTAEQQGFILSNEKHEAFSGSPLPTAQAL